MPFIVAYLITIGAVVAVVASFMAVVHVRNRVIVAIAQPACALANPAATGALHVRGWGVATILAIPGSAFAPGVIRRLLYLATFLIITLVDVTLASGRLAAAFGTEPDQLPIDVSWASALGWVAVASFFGTMSIQLRAEQIGHPWDALTEGAQRLLRWLSDGLFVITAVSGLLFWIWGALAAAGSYPLLPVILFMGSLGLALTVASGLSFWCAEDAWTTLWGVVLVMAAIVLRFVALIPELFVVLLRRFAYIVMSGVDIFFLGLARPLLLWWISSRLGKALGHPPVEEPIEWPEIGVAELPLEPVADEEDEEKLLRLPQFVRRLFHEERAA